MSIQLQLGKKLAKIRSSQSQFFNERKARLPALSSRIVILGVVYESPHARLFRGIARSAIDGTETSQFIEIKHTHHHVETILKL